MAIHHHLRGTASGYANGLAGVRADAIDRLDSFREVAGEKPAEPFTDYYELSKAGFL